MKRALALFFPLVVGFAGCSSSSTTAVTDAFAETVCKQVLRCDQGDAAAIRELVDSQAQCEAIVLTAIGNNSAYFPYLEDGTIKINSGALSECKALINANPCVDPDEFGVCDQVYEGTVRDGGGCTLDAQCRSGACTANSNQCGTCAASVTVGQPCDVALDNCLQQSGGTVSCEIGLTGATCVFEPDQFLTVGLGAECGNVNGVSQYCDRDLYCDNNDQCAARLAVGSLCDPDLDQCVYGTLCGDNGQDFRCVTVVHVTTAGGACDYLTNGAYGVCDLRRGLYCDPDVTNANGDPTCVALAGTGVENSQCFTDADCNGSLICVPNGFLDTEPGTCETTKKVDGSACDVDLECDSLDCRFSASAGQRVCQAKITCP